MYSSDDITQESLRSLDGTGKLITGDNDLLPTDAESGDEFAGDVRAREMPGLAAMHTLFMREHNRICDLINEANPGLDDDVIYENARRIVIAEMQNIVYGEYLPVVLGEKAMRDANLGKFEMQNSLSLSAFNFVNNGCLMYIIQYLYDAHSRSMYLMYLRESQHIKTHALNLNYNFRAQS